MILETLSARSTFNAAADLPDREVCWGCFIQADFSIFTSVAPTEVIWDTAITSRTSISTATTTYVVASAFTSIGVSWASDSSICETITSSIGTLDDPSTYTVYRHWLTEAIVETAGFSFVSDLSPSCYFGGGSLSLPDSFELIPGATLPSSPTTHSSATGTPGETTPPDSSSAGSPSVGTSSGLDLRERIAVGVSISLGTTLFLALGLCVLFRYRRRRNSAAADTSSVVEKSAELQTLVAKQELDAWQYFELERRDRFEIEGRPKHELRGEEVAREAQG